MANLRMTLSMDIVALSPTFVSETKMTKPSTLAMPSPCLDTSSISTSYVFPASTGEELVNPPLVKDPLSFPYTHFTSICEKP